MPWHQTERVSAVALTPPACRMLWIRAFAWEEAGRVTTLSEVFPVLAVQVRVVHRYGTRREQRPREAPTDAGLRALGWTFLEQETSHDAIVLDAEYNLIAVGDPLLEMDNAVAALVVCPWPEAEDEERLRERRGALEARAAEQVAARDRRTDVAEGGSR